MNQVIRAPDLSIADVPPKPQNGVERMAAGPEGLVARSALRTATEEPTLPAPR